MFDWLVNLVSRRRDHGFTLVTDHLPNQVNGMLGQSQSGCDTNVLNSLAQLNSSQFQDHYPVRSDVAVDDVVSKGRRNWQSLYNRNLRFLVNASLSNRYIPTSHAVHLSALLIRELRASPANRQGGV